MRPNSIRNALLAWYDRKARDLPWRRTRDPYAIWISEIMLQQTRVAAVIPYYEKFLKAFPDARALAEAPEDEVLAMWAGLGYYSRARNLRKSAAKIAQSRGFPCELDAIRSLDGIGEYTAAAIASIAFNLPHAAIDGNVRRVIVRLAGNDAIDVRAHAARLLDQNHPGRWNQAMMELGATVCTPRDPCCSACPIAKFCQAHRLGIETSLPTKRNKPEPVRLDRTLLLIRDRGRLLMVPSPRVHGFWDLPESVEGVRRGAYLGQFRHTITHRHYTFSVHEGLLSNRTALLDNKTAQWVALEKLDQIPLSTTARKALRYLDPA